MKTPDFVRTTSFRLTLLYAGLFASSTILLFGIIYWIATGSLHDQLRVSIEAEMATLEVKSSASAPGGIAQEITQRLRSRTTRPFLYRFTDAAGDLIAGNLSHSRIFVGWQTLQLVESDDAGEGSTDDVGDHQLLTLGRQLPSGSHLIIAADMFRLHEAEESIMRAFAWAAGITLLLALGGGVIVSQGFLGRVDRINRTVHAIMRGDLSDRIETRGTSDELDALGRNLNDMLDRLHSLMEGLKQVSNDIAHDMRTPLSRLKQRLEAVRADGRSIEDYEEAVDQALADADIALATFGALLRIAQIESGARRAKFADLDLSALLTTLAMTYAAVAEDAGKSLIWQVDPGLHIHGDRELLTQLFVNLIENALRHTPHGAQIKVSLHEMGGQPVTEITDNGPGIPENERENVFKRFYRLEASRSTSGSGLGLALTAAVVNLHGATISLDNNRPGLKVTLRFEARRSQ